MLPNVQVQWVGILSPFSFPITLNLISPDRSSALFPCIADHAALICSVFLTTPQFIALLLRPSCTAPGLPVAGSGCRAAEGNPRAAPTSPRGTEAWASALLVPRLPPRAPRPQSPVSSPRPGPFLSGGDGRAAAAPLASDAAPGPGTRSGLNFRAGAARHKQEAPRRGRGRAGLRRGLALPPPSLPPAPRSRGAARLGPARGGGGR